MRKLMTLPLFIFIFFPELIKFENWLFPKVKNTALKYIRKKVRSSKVLMRWINNPGTTLFEAFADSFNRIPVEVRKSWRNSVERGDFSA